MQGKLAIVAAILLASTVAPASARPRPRIAVTADAVAAVRRSAKYLQGLSSLALDAKMVIETFGADGRRVRDIDRLRYEYRGADGLRLDWSSNGERRRIYSNGFIVT